MIEYDIFYLFVLEARPLEARSFETHSLEVRPLEAWHLETHSLEGHRIVLV